MCWGFWDTSDAVLEQINSFYTLQKSNVLQEVSRITEGDPEVKHMQQLQISVPFYNPQPIMCLDCYIDWKKEKLISFAIKMLANIVLLLIKRFNFISNLRWKLKNAAI